MPADEKQSQNGRTTVSGDRADNLRVMMWAPPRVVSTAFTKCMSFVENVEIWFEPYALCTQTGDAYHRVHTDKYLPVEFEGNEEIFKEAARIQEFGKDEAEASPLSMLSPVTLKHEFDNLDPAKKFVFVKDIVAGMPPSRYQYLPDPSSGFKYFFFIRHPVKVYKSFRKGLLVEWNAKDPKTFHMFKDTGPECDPELKIFRKLYILWEHIGKMTGSEPIIVDSDDLVENPAAMLPRLCATLGIPYTESLLTWDASQDVIRKWISSWNLLNSSETLWMINAFSSSCFKPSPTTTIIDDDITADIKEALEVEMPYYEKMYDRRLTLNAD